MMRRQRERPRRLACVGLLLLTLLNLSCRLYNLQRKLSPAYAEFLSQVRYIVTKEEERIFLELPDSEKDAFIKEFWDRRDPDPDTEENEFKIEYFDRIETANKLFLSEGRPGWLTDRGRIFILFGPPMDRITNPLGGEPSGRCAEVWYYGSFPVVFRDQTCSGNFQLVTYDLTSLREINLMYMHELSLAQARAQKTFSLERAFFDFHWEVSGVRVSPERIEGTIKLAIPYSGIWFKEEEGLLKTDMEARLELYDAKNRLYWQLTKTFEIAIRETELKEKRKASFSQEIPFVLTENLEKLQHAKNALHCRLKNLTGDEEIRKVLEVNF